MKIKRFRITILEFTAAILIVIGIVYIARTVLNPHLSDVSELELEDLELQPETESSDYQWMIRSRILEITNNDADSNLETSAKAIPEHPILDEESNQLGTHVMELEDEAFGSPEQEMIDEDWLRAERAKTIEELNLRVRDALSEAKRLAPMVKAYQEQKEELVTKKVPPLQMVKELEVLNLTYEPYTSRLVEIYPLITDVEVAELLGNWVQEEATEIFEPLGW